MLILSLMLLNAVANLAFLLLRDLKKLAISPIKSNVLWMLLLGIAKDFTKTKSIACAKQ